jgi:hypothetical protein
LIKATDTSGKVAIALVTARKKMVNYQKFCPEEGVDLAKPAGNLGKETAALIKPAVGGIKETAALIKPTVA